jgi:hypothetical protein
VEEKVTPNLEEAYSRARSWFSRPYQWAVGALILTVVFFISFQFFAKQKRVKFIEQEVVEAKRQIHEAKSIFDASVTTIIEAHRKRSVGITVDVADELSNTGSIAGIVYRLARDQITNGAEAESYVDELVSPIVAPYATSLRGQLAKENSKLVLRLKDVSVRLALNVGAITAPQTITGQIKGEAGNLSPELDQALKELGFNMAVTAVFLPYDVADVAIIAAATRRGVISLSQRVFAQPIKRVAATPLIASIPIPGVGQLLSGVFLGLTAYDIKMTQDQFKVDVLESTTDALARQLIVSEKTVRSVAAENVKKFEILQDRIGGMALK